jgi:hypothetical protein
MAVNLSPVGGVAAQFFTNNGVILSGGKIFTYLAGTTTPATTYTSSQGSIAHTNPIILDSAGRVPSGEIWLTDGLTYKFVITDSNDVLIGTYDNLAGINSNFVNFTNSQEIQTATAGQTVFNLTAMQYQPGTNSLSVFVDGVNQYGPGAQYAYVETNSGTVTFVSGLHVGASVKFTTSQLNSSGAVSAGQISYDPPFTNSVVTNVQEKLSEFLSVKDFGAVGNGVTNDATAFSNAKTEAANVNKNLFVPSGNYLNGKPAGVVGDNILWNYYDGGDADNVLNINGDRGGFFADYDCKATQVVVGQFDEDQSTVSGGGFRDLIFFDTVDSDNTNYTAIGQKVTHSIRAYTQGLYSGGAYQAQYKDLVGGSFAALGNIQWDLRGVSAVTADAYQYGTGIASNEFAVHNPSAANGSAAQSKSMAAVQAIVRSRYANEDSTHISRGVYVSNNGLRITSGIEIISDLSDGFTSHYKFGLNMSAATVSQSAIYMPFSASGNAGTIIEYDSNDFSFYDRANNRFGWSVSGNNNFFVGSASVGVGAVPVAGARMFIDASTSSQSHLRLFPGATPSSPANGDVWFDGTNVKIQVGGVTKTFTLV